MFNQVDDAAADSADGPGRAVSAADEILLRALRQPETVVSLDSAEWDDLLRRARRARVLSRLAKLLDGSGTDGLPDRARELLAAALPVASHHERSLRWEVDRIRHALRPLEVQVVLLKGAAYTLAGLPAALGRLVSDVDILVPVSELARVEGALTRAGWGAMKLDPYDQRYYRTWMHELPPLRHERRRTVVDVHHNILPETSRFHPDPAELLDHAVPVGEGLSILAPEDMVLHSAAHLFVDGDLAGGLRDLIDLDALFRHFGRTCEGFWTRLAPRARELDLQRPLFYALRFSERLMETPIPDAARSAARQGRPLPPALALMDALVNRALVPASRTTTPSELAHWLLYVRSQWLRMPPGLLAQHLARKALRRMGAEPSV